MSESLKIFELTYGGGDRDWVAAFTVEEAKEIHESYTGWSSDDYDDSEWNEMPEEKWEAACILDTDTYYDDDDLPEDQFMGGYKIIETFAEYMDGREKADFIASTNF